MEVIKVSELTILFMILSVIALIGITWTYYRQKHPKIH